jgi:hypothetical protein
MNYELSIRGKARNWFMTRGLYLPKVRGTKPGSVMIYVRRDSLSSPIPFSLDNQQQKNSYKKRSYEWFLTRGLYLPKVETAIRGYREKILFDYDLVKEKYAF